MNIKKTFITALFVSITFISCSNEKESTQVLGDVASILNTVNEISGNSENETSEENNENETSEEFTSNGNEEIDKILNEYEMYITEYSKLTELAESRDPAKILEYASKLDKFKEINEVIQNAKEENNLSPEQISRLLRIQEKLTEAIQ